nr:DNA-binding pseudobarrel domain-containing protein [Tanacetum cinerariifolium]
MLRVFPITLTGAAKRWVDRLSLGTVDSWDLLKKPLSKGPVCHPKPLSSLKKSVILSRKVMKHCKHLLQWSGYYEPPIARLAVANSWNVDISSNSKGIAAIECPLNDEVKSIEEVKYGEFGRSSPFNNGAKYRMGPPGYNTCVDNRPPFEEKRPSLEKQLNKHLEESTRRRAEMEE